MNKKCEKNKGFTLIEILSAIIILGIIGIIAVVAVTNHIGDSRKSTFVNIARMYIEEARTIKARDELVQEPNDTEAVLIPFKEMKLDNKDDYQTPYGTLILEKSYVLIENNRNDINYYVAMMDDSGHAIVIENANNLTNDSVKYEKKYTDAIKPILSLKNAESAIEIGGAVYEVSDKNIDNASTVLLDSSILSSFRVEYNKDWYNEDKKITVIVNDDVEGYEYYLYNRLQKPSRNDSLWQENSEYVRGMGIYYVFVKSPDGEVSEGKKVEIDKIDKNAPTCTLKATGTQTADGTFISDALVSFDLVTDGTPSNTTSGVKRYGIGSLDDQNFKTHSIKGPETITYTGYVEDNAGNVNTCKITVNSDATEPDINYSPVEGVYNANKNVVVTPVDNQGIDYYHIHVYKNGTLLNKYENLKTANYTIKLEQEGIYEIRTMVVDLAGNKISKEPAKDGWYYQTYTIDKTKPTLTASATSGNFKTSASITLTAKDTGNSGLSSTNTYKYCLSTSGSSATGCTWTAYTSGTAFTISGTNQTRYLWVYAIKDNAGNVNGSYANNTTTYMIGSYKFDSTAPTLTASATSGNYKTSASIKLTAADTGGSNLSSSNTYKYCLSTSSSSATGCTWTTYTSGTAFTISATNTTRYLWVYPIKDNSGNVNDSKTFGTAYLIGTYKFDSKAPTLTLSASSSGTKVTATITVADTGGSGLYSSNTYKYCLASSNSTSGCSWKNYTSGTQFSATGSGGYGYLFVYPVKDNSGNVNDSKTFGTPYMIKSFSFDTSPPDCTITKSNTGTTSGVTVTWNCTDDSGVASVTVNSTSKSASGSVTGQKSNVTIVAKDTLGNSKTYTATVTAKSQAYTSSCVDKQCATCYDPKTHTRRTDCNLCGTEKVYYDCTEYHTVYY